MGHSVLKCTSAALKKKGFTPLRATALPPITPYASAVPPRALPVTVNYATVTKGFQWFTESKHMRNRRMREHKV